MLLKIDRWRKQVRRPMWVVGDQNIHAGTAQMDQWTDTLQCERMDTDAVPSYIRLDGHRGTDSEYTPTNHILRPVRPSGRPSSTLLRNPRVTETHLGIDTQGHYPCVADSSC
jgi:hypothetical protein